jgi:hypothetical protein
MGNTQAKLAASNHDDETIPGSATTTVQNQRQYSSSTKDRRDALKSSAKSYSETPQPKPSIRRLKLHTGKRTAVDGGHEEAFKKRKEAPMQTVGYHF